MSLELDVEGLRVLNISPFKVKQAKTCFTSTGSCDLRRPRLPRSIRLPEMEENKLLNSKKRIFSLKTIWEKQHKHDTAFPHITRRERRDPSSSLSQLPQDQAGNATNSAQTTKLGQGRMFGDLAYCMDQ